MTPPSMLHLVEEYLAFRRGLGCVFRRRRPPIPTEGDHPPERSDERRLMVG
jgi:hypothetical protein